MSLSLLQSYSSEEEEEGGEEAVRELRYDEDSDEDRNNGGSINRYKPLFDPNPASSSSLPSAFDAFSEVINSNLIFIISLNCIQCNGC